MPATSALTRLAYTVYGIAHRVHGHTRQREDLEGLAHAALRDALVGQPAARGYLVAIRERLDSGAFSGLREDDRQALHAALRALDTLAA